MSRRDRYEPAPAAPDQPIIDNEPAPAAPALVRALVLHSSVYGRCGEVKEFPADEVEALRLAGFVDTHPNAIASAGG